MEVGVYLNQQPEVILKGLTLLGWKQNSQMCLGAWSLCCHKLYLYSGDRLSWFLKTGFSFGVRVKRPKQEKQQQQLNNTFFWKFSSYLILSVSVAPKAIYLMGKVEKPQWLEENKSQNAISCGQESRSLSIATDSMNIH